MKTVRRYDFAPISGHERTSEGFLRVWCRAAKVGVQTYTRTDGSQIREYRPPEEVGNPESLTTFGMKPVTFLHPEELVDSSNARTLSRGTSGSEVVYTDGFVKVALSVTDEETIKAIERGDAREVSAGYKVDFDPTPGITPDGQPYDGIQRNIRVNHIAIVPRGRAGSDVRLLLDRLDSSDGVAFNSDSEDFSAKIPSNPPPVSMAKVKLDSLEIEIPNDVAGSIQGFVAAKTQQISDLTTKLDTANERIDTLEEELTEAITARDMAEGRADALEEDSDRDDSDDSERLDWEKVDELIAQRLDTLETLAPALPEEYVFEGQNEQQLYHDAFTNLTGEEPRADANPDQIKGVVEGILFTLSRQDAPEGDDEDEDEDDEEDDEDEGRGDSVDELRQAVRNRSTGTRDANATLATKVTTGYLQPLSATK